jgi:carboxymethylenebutenolidase
MGFHVDVALPSGDNFRAYEAPVHATPALGAVVIVHEWFGLNAGMRLQAERFAAAGFHALAIDLYEGKVAGDAASAKRLAAELTPYHALRVVAAATEYMNRRSQPAGRVGLAGFCLGGAIALAAASELDDIGATVTFCGMPLGQDPELERIRAPVMGHYGVRDPLLPVARPQAMFAKLAAAGKHARFHAYDAGHAFMRSGSQSYHAVMAELAWQRTLGLFHEALS